MDILVVFCSLTPCDRVREYLKTQAEVSAVRLSWFYQDYVPLTRVNSYIFIPAKSVDYSHLGCFKLKILRKDVKQPKDSRRLYVFRQFP